MTKLTRLVSGVILIFFSVLYASTIPWRLSSANFGGDGGDFMAAILTNGIPHPSGYPTYLIFARLLQYLPIPDVYFKGILASILPSLATIILTSLLVVRMSKPSHKILAGVMVLSTGFGIGFCSLYWSQSVIVEVYSLHVLFIVTFLWWAILLLEFNPSHRLAPLLALSGVLGIGIGNHLTYLFLTPAYAYLLFTALRQRRITLKKLAGLILITMAGMLVYLYLPIQARQHPPINWGNPQTWDGFTWLVSGKMYQRMMFAIPVGNYFSRLSALSRTFLEQFGIIGLLMGLFGISQAELIKRPLFNVLLWIMAVYLVFSIGYLTDDSIVYIIPSLVIFAIWIGLSIPILWPNVWKNIPIGKITIALFFISLFVRLPAIREQVNPQTDYSAANYAESVLKELPNGSIVVTNNDNNTFPLWYYHFGLGWRPDIAVVVQPLTKFPWYQEELQYQYPRLNLPPTFGETDNQDTWFKELLTLNPGRHVQFEQE